jgi:hypothetical protein
MAGAVDNSLLRFLEEHKNKYTVDYLIMHNVIMHKSHNALHLHRSRNGTQESEVHNA